MASLDSPRGHGAGRASGRAILGPVERRRQAQPLGSPRAAAPVLIVGAALVAARASLRYAQENTPVIPTERSERRDLSRLSSRAKPRDLPRLSSRAKPRDLERGSIDRGKDLSTPLAKPGTSHAPRASGCSAQDDSGGRLCYAQDDRGEAFASPCPRSLLARPARQRGESCREATERGHCSSSPLPRGQQRLTGYVIFWYNML